MDHRLVARQRRMLRLYKRQKQRAIVEMKKMSEAQRKLQWHAMNVHKIQASNQNLLLCLLQQPQQQHSMAAPNATIDLDSHQITEEVCEGTYQLNMGPRVEQIQDQSLELQLDELATTNVEVEGGTSGVKRKGTPLNKIKGKARQKHLHPKKGKHVVHLTNAGKIFVDPRACIQFSCRNGERSLELQLPELVTVNVEVPRGVLRVTQRSQLKQTKHEARQKHADLTKGKCVLESDDQIIADGSLELQLPEQVITIEQGAASCVNGKTRLKQMKDEARRKRAHLKGKSVLQLDNQINSDGDENGLMVKVKKACRQGERKNNASGLSRDTISQYFCMPIPKAAKELKVGLTMLKKRCRELGIPRWPERKLTSLKTLIKNVQELWLEGGEWSDSKKQEALELLEQERKLMEERPDHQLDKRIKNLKVAFFKANKKRKLMRMLERRPSNAASVECSDSLSSSAAHYTK